MEISTYISGFESKIATNQFGSLYLHIPFCKQACFYCDFHFSTSLKNKNEMVLALAKELEMRKKEFENTAVQSIYFGGGTPSILSIEDLDYLLSVVYDNYKINTNPEITLEANPDDLTDDKIIALSNTKINRLSIGIQSFFEDDLKMMHRAHTSAEAKKCLTTATAYFDNISIDLIYGIPGMSNKRWQENIETALGFKINHISSYALTVEPKTALKKLILDGKIAPVLDEVAENHFRILTEILQKNDFIHYELSNFGKENYFSQNNSGYWLGKKYIGIGPSAHSFNGVTRSWNVANNSLYINKINVDSLPSEMETLTITDQYNEYVMTGLRTIWGISLEVVEQKFGSMYLSYLKKQSQKFINDSLLEVSNNTLKTTQKGKFLTDGLASDLFWID